MFQLYFGTSYDWEDIVSKKVEIKKREKKMLQYIKSHIEYRDFILKIIAYKSHKKNCDIAIVQCFGTHLIKY